MCFVASFGFSFHVIMLTETWYQDNAEVFNASGYNSQFINRRNKIGGGVLLMVKNDWKCDVVKGFTKITDDFKILTLTYGNNNLVVLYRPPSGNTSVFLEFLDTLLGCVNDNSFKLVIGADINIDMLNASTAQHDFVTLLETNAFINTITTPTHIQPNSETLHDLFITNIDNEKQVSRVVGVDISDHLPIFLITDPNIAATSFKKTNETTFKDINPFTLEQFRSKLSQISWQEVYGLDDPDAAHDTFILLWKSAHTNSLPYKTAKAKKARKLWITNTALKL